MVISRSNFWSTLGATLTTGLLVTQSAIAATTATVDLKTQKYIGGVSDLDRSKYFNIHMTPSENKMTDAELSYLVNDLNVGFGRQFWSPFSAYSGDAPYPSEADAMSAGPSNIANIKNHASYPYFSKRLIVTDHPSKAYVFGEDPNLAAQWAVDYFKHYYDNTTRPEFYEPLNEPFVHAGDFSTNEELVRTEMTNLFKAIGQKFDQNNIDTKVIGYSSAWPSMELWDFDHFNGRMKMFMDTAGPYIDSFSIHPYDGVNVTGASNERSGSNLESLLDMIETYSYFKWNSVKPITISEFGGIEQGYGDTYTDLRAAQSIASQNKMLMQLLNRQDRLLTTIPFNTGKSAWHYNAANNWNPYGAAVLRPDPNSIVNGEPTNFLWTKRVDIYKLWSNVKGKRVKVETDNPDIQLNAFVDGNKAYVAVNTLADYWETVNLDFANSLGTITEVRQKRIVVRANANPTYEDKIVTTPTSHSMEPGETVVWEYTFAAPITFDNTLDSKDYYAPEHLVSITSGITNSFTFNGLAVTGGKSVIRMSIGRAHGSSFQPTVTVNGQAAQVNLNWAGGNQTSRGEFFGVIEIPVDNSLLNTNNTVNITFPDTGGRIASVVLQVNNDSEASTVLETVDFANVITSIPSGNSYDVTVDYTAGASRDIVAEFWQNSTYLGGTKVTVAAGAGQKTITVPSSKTTINGETGYLFKTSIRPVGGDWTTAIEYNQTGSIDIVDNALPTIDSFAFSTVVTELPQQATQTIAVDYDATVSRDIVVEIWQGGGWQAAGVATVQAGTGTENVTVTLGSEPVAGATGYTLKGSIRPVGTDWTQNLATDQQSNIAISGTAPPATYTALQFKSNSKCLDNTAGATTDGNQQQIWSCYSNVNQSFLFTDQGLGYWTIQNQASSKCLDKTNSIYSGALVHQWTCDATNDNQLFEIVDDGLGFFQLKNKHSGMCLAIVGGDAITANGTQIEQAVCSTADSQKLSFY